jgi:hypothetical protein
MAWSSHALLLPLCCQHHYSLGTRVETPESWPPSDDMNIETCILPLGTREHTGSTPWVPIATLSRDPSPFWPEGTKVPPPKRGSTVVPTVGLGENPGTPLVGTPEYNYDLTSLPSHQRLVPHAIQLHPQTPCKCLIPTTTHKGCTKHCFDVVYTLHHHDHSATEPTWTTAMMIEERPQKHPIIWGYGMEHKAEPTWERLDRWDRWEEDELDTLSGTGLTPSRISHRPSSVGTGTEKGIMSRTDLC